MRQVANGEALNGTSLGSSWGAQRRGPNPFADPVLASSYEHWYETRGRRADRLERALLRRLLARLPQARTLLEVGCGTGHFSRWFREIGLQVAGLDLSLPMLAEAVRPGDPPAVRGDALALPFCRDAFDLVALITTLEFLLDPRQAVAEALRVGRQGLILGVLNSQSLLGRRLRREAGPIWGSARLFKPRELSRLVQRATAGQRVSLIWRTTLWPLWPGALPLPWGGFIGMAVIRS